MITRRYNGLLEVVLNNNNSIKSFITQFSAEYLDKSIFIVDVSSRQLFSGSTLTWFIG